jgi:DUF4097 and DUF4098 domain-containing protein YvlB
MKSFKILFLVIALTALLHADNEFRKEIKMESGKRLEIDLTSGGSLTIIGWDKNSVLIEAQSGGDDIDNFKFDIDENRSGLSLDVTHFGHSRRGGDLDVRIHVPQKSDLELETMGGEISIDNVEGRIGGETMGGDLELSRLKGRIKMTTMGGDINLRDSDLDGEVKTMGGEVEFEDVIGDIEGSSMGGDVTYRNVKRRGSSGAEKEVSISTMGGEIKVDSAPAGATVSTMGGDVHIRSAAKYVKAKTMGGDIDIDAIDGAAKASTMGGDVTVTMIGDPEKGERDVDLSSMGGDIILTVPAGLSMDFDIKLTYTERARKEYKIISDFPINIEQSEEWDYSQGSARKYIFGTGKVGGGKNRVRIETTNGNIIIKKG